MVYLSSNNQWLTANELFVPWAEDIDQKIIDYEFVDKYIKDMCDYGRAAHLPGKHISTNVVERLFWLIKDEKKLLWNYPDYTGDFVQTFCAISNHKVMVMKKRIFYLSSYVGMTEWKAINLNSKRIADTSVKCSVYYVNTKIVP